MVVIRLAPLAPVRPGDFPCWIVVTVQNVTDIVAGNSSSDRCEMLNPEQQMRLQPAVSSRQVFAVNLYLAYLTLWIVL
jgi:hypothetical protein